MQKLVATPKYTVLRQGDDFSILHPFGAGKTDLTGAIAESFKQALIESATEQEIDKVCDFYIDYAKA